MPAERRLLFGEPKKPMLTKQFEIEDDVQPFNNITEDHLAIDNDAEDDYDS